MTRLKILNKMPISRSENAPGYDKARCDIRVYVHDVTNKIGRGKNAPDYASARYDIRVCMHAVPNKIGRVKNALD